MKKRSLLPLLFYLILMSFLLESCSGNYKQKFKEAYLINIMAVQLAEGKTNLIKDSWKTSIEDHYVADEVGNRIYVKDFNEALSIKNAQFEKNGINSGLRDFQKKIDSAMQKLSNPPGDYKEAYANLTKMYASVSEYLALAVNPKGSLLSYGQSCNQLSSDIYQLSKMIEVQVPDINSK